MQSIILIFKEKECDIKDFITSFTYQVSNFTISIFNNEEYVNIVEDISILNEFDEEEKSIIPFDIGCIYIYEYNNFKFARKVLFYILSEYISKFNPNTLYIDIDDNLYQSEFLYNKLKKDTNWDWRA